jgi:hypothetical protein
MILLHLRKLKNGLIGNAWKGAGDEIHVPRVAGTICLVGYGVLLVVASIVVGVDSVQIDGKREVGFIAAPNWSITAIAIWPVLFYVLRVLVDGADLVFGELDRSPMAWLAGAAPRGTIAATWARHKRLLRRLTVVVLFAALAFSFVEWWGYSGKTLLRGATPNEGELDWSSIRAGYFWFDNVTQAIFTLFAFLYQGVAIALMATFAATTILISRTMGLHASGIERPSLLIDIESNDPSNRVGFERFVMIIDYMISFVALAFVNFFLTRIQNAYLRSDAASLFDFLSRDLRPRSNDSLNDLFQSGLLDFSSVAVSVGAVIALFQCFFFFNATLRHSAMQARNRSDHELIRGAPAAKALKVGLDRDKVRERLRGANVWPLGYSDLVPTLSFLAICLVSIIFYRIGVYLVFLWIIGWIVARTAASLIKGRS